MALVMQNNGQALEGTALSVIIFQNIAGPIATTTVPGITCTTMPVSTSSFSSAKLSELKPIQPAPPKGSQAKKTTPPLKPPKKFRDEDNEIQRCKRRLDFAKLGLPFHKPNPVAVARRNERERKRVKQINSTFLTLRDHVPNTYCSQKNPNKMSKVDTLRGAIDYIRNMHDLVTDYDTVNAALGGASLSEESLNALANAASQLAPMAAAATDNISDFSAAPQQTSYSSASMNSPGSTYSSAGSSTSEPLHSPDQQPPLSPEEEELFNFACWF